MLKLQARLTLAFLLLVGVITGLISFALYTHIHAQFDADFGDRIQLARDAVRQRLRSDAKALDARVEAVASHPEVEELRQDLDHGRVDQVKRRLLSMAPALRQSAHLDVLWIFDVRGRRKVLAAPHRSGSLEPTEALERFLNRGGDDHCLVTEAVDRSGRPVVLPVLEVSATSGRLLIVGGRAIGSGVAEDLAIGGFGDMHVTIRDAAGSVVADTFAGDDEPPAEPTGYETAVVELKNPGEDETALVVSVHLSREPLEKRIESMFQATAVVAGAAALLALLLGWLMARRITRPIDQLVQVTRRVAAGKRQVELPVGRRDEIGELMDAFANMIQEVDESEDRLRRAERVAAWQEIARELAHEIKNPLTPIQMAIETVRRTYQRKHPRFDEIFEESTKTILEEVDRLKTIVSEFSQFARMPRPNPHPCELNELVHQAFVLYRETDGVEVTEALDQRLKPQHLDPDRMTQVIQNLLKNAIQATVPADRPGKVHIATRLTDHGEVELSIEDNGCGIPENDLPRVFTPYFTSKAGGTGLGLAVVHRIVDGHDGRIGVSSQVGSGTRFVVLLPT